MFSVLRGPGRDWLKRNLPRIPLLIKLSWGLFRDPRVPKPLKAALLGVLAYVASPVDLIPDFIPVLGLADDVLLLFAAFELFVRLAPKDVVAEMEARYDEDFGSLQADLKQAEQHFGRLWSWAVDKIEEKSRKYVDRVKDQTFVQDIERQTTTKH